MSKLIEDSRALAVLAKRIKKCPAQMNNSALYAGSPMYFYCRICGHESDCLPESYSSSPKCYCAPCQELKDAYPKLTDSTIKAEATGDPK